MNRVHPAALRHPRTCSSFLAVAFWYLLSSAPPRLPSHPPGHFGRVMLQGNLSPGTLGNCPGQLGLGLVAGASSSVSVSGSGAGSAALHRHYRGAHSRCPCSSRLPRATSVSALAPSWLCCCFWKADYYQIPNCQNLEEKTQQIALVTRSLAMQLLCSFLKDKFNEYL